MTTAPVPHEARLRRLLDASASIVADLDLTSVLRRIVEVAVDVVGARYGALGVIAPDGHGLEQFVHVGAGPDVVARIGELPRGRGLLGALVADPHPIRLAHLGDDPRSAGFPPGHPRMDSFLGVPVRVRGEVFGNLYLTEAATGDFTADDEAVAIALAATAGIAVHNARLYADAGRRHQWLLASSELTRRVLATAGTGPATQDVVEVVRVLSDCPLAAALEDVTTDSAVVLAAAGEGAEALAGTTVRLGEAPHRTLLSGDARSLGGLDGLATDAVPSGGPALLLPLAGPRPLLLVAVRPPGTHPFTGPELEMASTFAAQVGVALELARAREDQQRMTLLEDRARIARDLHDHVIQQLFAAGMTVQGVASTLDDPERAAALESAVDALDEAVKRVRTSIFHLRTSRDESVRSLRAAVLDVAREVGGGLGFEPHVSFEGPVDAVGTGPLLEDVVAVVREGLSNVARHAAASSAVVRLHADRDVLRVEVEDDGCGVEEPPRSSGLTNLWQRAERHGGHFEVGPSPAGAGTLLVWAAPVG